MLRMLARQLAQKILPSRVGLVAVDIGMASLFDLRFVPVGWPDGLLLAYKRERPGFRRASGVRILLVDCEINSLFLSFLGPVTGSLSGRSEDRRVLVLRSCAGMSGQDWFMVGVSPGFTLRPPWATWGSPRPVPKVTAAAVRDMAAGR